ncbi:hypothetical protein BRC91_08465 [Halobacteriales archaeon QS_4_62_28]|nr:MAG: hypothetical protein BRC91_08465 [Halobacteriales archaeon QS_4_62_28]
MNLKTIAGLALAALLVTGSAAALPGNAPAQADDYANENADTAATNASETTNESEAADADRQGPPDDTPAASDDDRRGPPSDLPDGVPDFVSEIHSLIGDKLAGDLDGSLGEQISDVTPDDDSESETDSDSETEANA